MAQRILIVDDDPGIVKVLSDRLRHRGFDVRTAPDGAQAVALVDTFHPDLMLLDLQLPVLDGMEVLKEIRGQAPDIVVIVITAFGTVARAVEAMKAGAYDFLVKPLDFNLVELTIRRALEHVGLTRQLGQLQEERATQFPGVIGTSPIIQKVLELARRVAASDATVLLQGETGTGKEVLARAIHNWSSRAKRAFVAVNCTALPESLLESELFGHEKGAFTGAHKLRRGRFEIAAGGTLFLDEIGEMPLPLQARLLRVLEGHGFERVGGDITIPNETRIMAANNQRLADAVQQGRFREDLYHRLNVVMIEVPPLRERQEDIRQLADFFIRKYCAATKQPLKTITAEALEVLGRYPWPGNVRELENALERAVVLTTEPEIRLEDLPEQVIDTALSKADACTTLPHSYHAAVTEFRRHLIQEALDKAGGNQAAAARSLGLQRTYLARLIRNLDIWPKPKSGKVLKPELPSENAN
jgi:DNA-binding NtrC family response regulator